MSISEPATEASFEDLHSLTLVLSTARSGSTLLSRDMAGLGGLGMPKEYLRGLRAKRGEPAPTEKDVLERVAMGVHESAPGVASVELMVSQTPAIFEALHGERIRSVEALPGVISWARQRFQRVFPVFLVRNALDQAISRVLAEADRSANGVPGAENVPPDVNQQILANLGRIVRDRNILLAAHATHADIGLLLTYDELHRRPEDTAKKLVGHARAAGFEVHSETVTRRLETATSQERPNAVREGFFEYLRTDVGIVPGR